MVKKQFSKVKIDYATGVVEGRLLQVRNQKASAELSLVKTWSTKIKPQSSPKVLSLIRELSTIDPVPLQHVKRLQKFEPEYLTTILCSTDLMSSEELEKKLIESGAEYTPLEERLVPRHCPPTKELALQWGKEHWPLVWKGNPNDQILAAMEFDMDQIKSFLKLVAEESRQIQTPQLPCVTAIVDPKSKEVMAISADKRHEYPLDHSVMRCINIVSENEQEARKNKKPEEYRYLCNDYHVYTTHEPCTMCSMALIHSRVSRLIYVKPSDLTGALSPQSGEGYEVHNHKLLNSSFEVFQWIGDEYEVPSICDRINA